MDDLKAFRVPALILSGGEPLLRPDIFDIAKRAKPWASTLACHPTAR
jgi:MoaA/NifB/PqqE/SkfB family radical SAM enzyme